MKKVPPVSVAAAGPSPEEEPARGSEEVEDGVRAELFKTPTSKRETGVDSLLKQMTLDTQKKTRRSVRTMEKQLEDTLEIADATQGALDSQGDQLEAVRRDVTAVEGSLKHSNMQFNEFESWRVFGGKSKVLGKKAEKKFQPIERSGSNRSRTRQAAAKYGVAVPERPRPRRFASAPAHLRVPSPESVKWELAPSPKSSKARVAWGLEGRDAEEEDALNVIRNNDDDINRGLDQVDALIDRLADRADVIRRTASEHNDKLDDVAGKVDGVSRGVSRVNARAKHNVGRMS